MGHVLIQHLQKEYVDRRHKRRDADDPNGCSEHCIRVLDDVNLEFSDGEMVCILGPSGCGKSTMLRIVAGFDKEYSGNIFINDKEVRGPSSEHIFVFQHSALLPWMTMRENVGLGLRHLSDKELMNQKIQEYIEMVELEGFEDRYPHQLSGGMQRRAELARALAAEPDIMFMDEPFAGLDFLTRMKMREEVVNMHEFIGKTILFVTHDIDDALIMGDRLVVLSGRPSHVKISRRLDFPRPRDFRKEPELSELRNEIFLMLGVNYAV
jgi:ABC-type nitrate/sulfonate/bicarbonate transport system ATPase subunit